MRREPSPSQLTNCVFLNSTWILTTEDVVDPPKRLAEECKKAGIEDGVFRVCDIGETLFF